MKASSNTSHASSRASRCRGSIADASRGDKLKKSASNSATSPGNRVTSRPSRTTCQKSRGLAAAGNRHASPMIAMSVAATTSSARYAHQGPKSSSRMANSSRSVAVVMSSSMASDWMDSRGGAVRPAKMVCKRVVSRALSS